MKEVSTFLRTRNIDEQVMINFLWKSQTNAAFNLELRSSKLNAAFVWLLYTTNIRNRASSSNPRGELEARER